MTVVLLAITLWTSPGFAQEPTQPFSSPGQDGAPNFITIAKTEIAQTDSGLLPPAPASEPMDVVDVLPGLPRPADQPASLHMLPVPTYGCAPVPGPYFDRDPLLDPPSLPQPGWLADVEVGILLPHVSNEMHAQVLIGGGPAHVVALPSARLNWTASPRVELGYRLPDGFGEFTLSYRFLGSQGTGVTQGIDAPANLTSRLAIHIADLDYANNELSICSWWTKWHIGLRGADIFYDSHANEPLAAAAGGSGIFEQSETNSFWGIGPHAALEVERRVQDWGLTMFGRLDAATMLGMNNQGFFERSIGGASGQTLRANAGNVPVVNLNLGMSYRPPDNQRLRLFLGYQYEYWWNTGRLDGLGPLGVVYDVGAVLRADYNY